MQKEFLALADDLFVPLLSSSVASPLHPSTEAATNKTDKKFGSALAAQRAMVYQILVEEGVFNKKTIKEEVCWICVGLFCS